MDDPFLSCSSFPPYLLGLCYVVLSFVVFLVFLPARSILLVAEEGRASWRCGAGVAVLALRCRL